jgi:hypothetical protein
MAQRDLTVIHLAALLRTGVTADARGFRLGRSGRVLCARILPCISLGLGVPLGACARALLSHFGISATGRNGCLQTLACGSRSGRDAKGQSKFMGSAKAENSNPSELLRMGIPDLFRSHRGAASQDLGPHSTPNKLPLIVMLSRCH